MLRQLGKKELFGLALNDKIPFNIVYHFTLNAHITSDTLAASLNKLLKKYQALNVLIKDKTFYATSNSVPIIFHEHFDDSILQQVIHTELHTSLNLTTGPLFKVNYFYEKNHTIFLFTLNHIVVDGRGSLAVVVDLLCMLLNKPSPIFLSDDFYPLAPAIESLLPNPENSTSTLNKNPDETTRHFSSLPMSELDTGRLEKELSPDIFAELTVLATAHNISITALLLAKLILSTYNKIQQDPKQPNIISFNISLMVDARHLLRVTHFVGSFSFPFFLHFEIDATRQLIELAQEIAHAIKEFSLKKAQTMPIGQQAIPLLAVNSLGRLDKFLGSVSEHIIYFNAYNAIHAYFTTEYSMSMLTFNYQNKHRIIFQYPTPLVNTEIVEAIYQEIFHARK